MGDQSPAPTPGCRELFLGFAGVSAIGFGGVLPWARRMVVERRRWQTAEEFTDLLALCQFLPGPNIINFSVCLGARFRGLRGAVSAFAGVILVPVLLMMVLGALYGVYGDQPVVARMFRGLAAAASGLVLATAWKIAAPMAGRPRGILVAVCAFAAVAVLRAPLVPALLVLVPGSLLVLRGGR